MTLQLAWYDWVGLIGTLLVVLAFFLLQAGRLVGNGIAYQLLNLFGAAGILVSLLGAFNPAVFVMELTWVLISAYGIARSLRSRKAPRP
jgi:paired small multidrug resistance pump